MTDQDVLFKFEGRVSVRVMALATWMLGMHEERPKGDFSKEERLWATYIVVMTNANQQVGGTLATVIRKN